MIVIEGPDSAGKTTLVKQLATDFPEYQTYHSKGPEKYPGEINERLFRILCDAPHLTIFDRHPTISHVIYDGKTTIHRGLLGQFWFNSPQLVLCLPDPCPLLPQDETAEYNTPEFLAYLEQNHTKIIDRYKLWARLFGAFHYNRMNYSELVQWLSRPSSSFIPGDIKNTVRTGSAQQS